MMQKPGLPNQMLGGYYQTKPNCN